MLTAITRAVSPALNRCELEYLTRQEIDIEKAAAQHAAYEACLAGLGAAVLSLPAEPELPDSVFVEDPAVVVDEVAVMTRMGAASRRAESESLARALTRYRPLRWLREPATLEGGDVLRIASTLYVGLSPRTNAAGITQLRAELAPFGYTVVPVAVSGCLHLKSACSYAGEQTIVANRAWFDSGAFQGFRIMDVAPDEPAAANVLSLGGTVLMPSAFPATAAALTRLGFRVRTLDISELMKAEAAVTCSSLVFESAAASRPR